jgi:hypothetical protein
MQLTLNIPDDIARQLGPIQSRLPQILALGLREMDAEDAAGFRGLADVLEFLADLPSPEQILALRPAGHFQDELERLLERRRDVGLSDEDERQWRQYEYIEHLVRKAKINAARQLAAKS